MLQAAGLCILLREKAISPGEKLVGPCSTLFMDEISTGLDSSTTYLIVKCVRNFVHMTQVTHSSNSVRHKCVHRYNRSQICLVAYMLRFCAIDYTCAECSKYML